MEQSSKNLSNVLLILAVGSLIYYLMKPSKNKDVKSEMPSALYTKTKAKSVNKPNSKSREDFADSDNYEKTNPLKPVPDSALVNGLDNSQYFANNKIKDSANVTNLNEMPITKTNIKNNVVGSITGGDMNKVNNFNAFDDDYTPFTNLNGKIDSYGISVDWSDLDNAFKGPLADTTSALDLVKMNNTEMKNYNSNDFLPKEVIDGAFDDYSQAKYNLDNDNLINTDRYVIGINTVGQSLKNGSHDIRGTIPNPKFSVSPWNNSTYEPDYNIKPLC